MDNDELELTEKELDDYVDALNEAEEIWEKDKTERRRKNKNGNKTL